MNVPDGISTEELSFRIREAQRGLARLTVRYEELARRTEEASARTAHLIQANQAVMPRLAALAREQGYPVTFPAQRRRRGIVDPEWLERFAPWARRPVHRCTDECVRFERRGSDAPVTPRPGESMVQAWERVRYGEREDWEYAGGVMHWVHIDGTLSGAHP